MKNSLNFASTCLKIVDTRRNGPNVVVAALKSGAIVFMLLKSAPIYQTIEVRWKVYSQPHGSYGIQNNVLIFSWGDPAESIKQYPLEVTYVPDPTSKNPAFKALSVKDSVIFADGVKLMDAPR